jgi:hypothetical protein
MKHPLLLRLTQTSTGQSQFRVEVALEASGQARQTATCTFRFELADQDREDLRWYLEDYPQFPLNPAPQIIAARIEQRLAELAWSCSRPFSKPTMMPGISGRHCSTPGLKS